MNPAQKSNTGCRFQYNVSLRKAIIQNHTWAPYDMGSGLQPNEPTPLLGDISEFCTWSNLHLTTPEFCRTEAPLEDVQMPLQCDETFKCLSVEAMTFVPSKLSMCFCSSSFKTFGHARNASWRFCFSHESIQSCGGVREHGHFFGYGSPLWNPAQLASSCSFCASSAIACDPSFTSCFNSFFAWFCTWQEYRKTFHISWLGTHVSNLIWY